jgi:hypothetical protein
MTLSWLLRPTLIAPLSHFHLYNRPQLVNVPFGNELYLCIHLLIIATEHLGELNAVLRFGHA